MARKHPKHERIRKPIIYTAGVFAVALVIAYEVVKANHHSRLVGIVPETDWPLTAFWYLDAVVAAIVTFALVLVTLQFERLEGLLDQHAQEAADLSEEYLRTKAELADVTKDMKNVATSLRSEGLLLARLNSPEIQSLLYRDTDLQGSLTQRLGALAEAWVDLVVEEDHNNYPVFGDKHFNFGLLCWRIALDRYLEEEAKDIRSRTVATNLELYTDLLDKLVRQVREAASKCGSDCQVQLFAVANLLPAEYYNWKEYPKGPVEPNTLAGTAVRFMNGYRTKMRSWFDIAPGTISLTRLLLVEKLGSDSQHRPLMNSLAVQPLNDLRQQAKYQILCDRDTREPHLFPLSEVKRFVDVSKGLLEVSPDGHAFAIAEWFDDGAVAQSDTSVFVQRPLIEVFCEQLHSAPARQHALYLPVDNDDRAARLSKQLPTIPSAASVDLRSADFLAISLVSGQTAKLIGCVAAQSKPNYETMSLHLITDEAHLQPLGEFIKYATAESKAIVDLLD